MIRSVDFLEVLSINVGIDLGSGDVGMTQHLLNGAEISSSLQKVGCEGVAESMRGDPFLDPCLLNNLLQDLQKTHSGEGSPSGIEEEDLRNLVLSQTPTGFLEVLG